MTLTTVREDPRPLSPTVHVEKTGTEEQALGGAPLVLVVWGHWWGSGEGMCQPWRFLTASLLCAVAPGSLQGTFWCLLPKAILRERNRPPSQLWTCAGHTQ